MSKMNVLLFASVCRETLYGWQAIAICLVRDDLLDSHSRQIG